VWALAEGERILASAERYDLEGMFDGRPVRVCGIGTVCEPSPRSLEHARVLVDALADDAAQQGAVMALLFPQPGVANGRRRDFQPIPSTDLTLIVSEPTRDGAPMTVVRCGEDRDLAAIVAMGSARAGRLRFHLDRDVDFVHYAITARRWLAGPDSADAGQLHFWVADEGSTAAAYAGSFGRRGRRAVTGIGRARGGAAPSDDPCVAPTGVSASAGDGRFSCAFDGRRQRAYAGRSGDRSSTVE
jgi:hypothetical protein